MTPADRDQLAADYVIGLLEGAEAARARNLLGTDPVFAAAVESWRQKMSAIDETAAPVPPSDGLWPRIAAAVASLPQDAREAVRADPSGRGPTVTPLPTRGRAGWRGHPAAWRWATVASLAASLLLAVGWWNAAERASRAPMLVAVLVTEGNKAGAIVNTFADGRTELLPLESIAVPPGRALEIWTLWDRARGPVSVGLIDSARRTPLRLDSLPRPARDQIFEITLEPATGSPTGRPTGPVLMKGTASTAL